MSNFVQILAQLCLVLSLQQCNAGITIKVRFQEYIPPPDNLTIIFIWTLFSPRMLIIAVMMQLCTIV